MQLAWLWRLMMRTCTAVLLCAFTQPALAHSIRESTGDDLIVPGERIGSLRLNGTLRDIASILGTDVKREPGKGMWRGTTYYNWAVGAAAVADDASGQILWISVSRGWESVATREGLGIGVPKASLTAALGEPTLEFRDDNGESMYFDREGIRFFLAAAGPLTGRVVGVRIVWPHTRPGDGLIVPGERISSIALGMALEQVVKTLGGGYTKKQMGRYTAYVWLHRGLRIEAEGHRMLGIDSFSTPYLEGAGVTYSTAEGLGVGSRDARIRELLGEPSDQTEQGPLRWWIYHSRGIVFALDAQAQVASIEVIPRQPWIDRLRRAFTDVERSVTKLKPIAGEVLWLVFGLVLVFMLVHRRRRRVGYEQVAIRCGMTFVENDESLFDEPFMRLPLFRMGLPLFREGYFPSSEPKRSISSLWRRWRLIGTQNVLRGQCSGVDVVLFEHRPFRNDSSRGQEVAAFRLPARSLPEFQLAPERTVDKIASALGAQDIDFESHPAFSQRYRLRGTDEEAVRKLFGWPALEFFSRSAGWSVQGQGEWLIIYKKDVLVPPAKLEEFLENTSRVMRLFLIGKDRVVASGPLIPRPEGKTG